MTRIVFLDIDGVLNGARFFDAQSKRDHRRKRGQAKAQDPADAIDPAAVEHLNAIVARTGAQVVISSSWRCAFGLSEIARFLDARGFKGLVCGSTPVGYGIARGQEIEGWLRAQDYAAHTVESFVILDDIGDMAHLASRLVQTDTLHGLQPEHVERAVAMLVPSENPPPPVAAGLGLDSRSGG